MAETSLDDDVYVDTLIDELRHEMYERGYHESLEFLDEEDAIDNGVDLMLAVTVANGLDIPIPEHFIKDFEYLDRVGDIPPTYLDDLLDTMADQRERGLISY